MITDPFLAEIRILPYNFAPTGWAMCNGQLLSISQNTALFSLLGTNYGGNGQTTFGLPNLQGAFPMHWNQGPGLSNRGIGEIGGVEVVTLTSSEMPAHAHALMASAGPATVPAQSPVGAAIGPSSARPFAPGPANATMALQASQLSGSNFPHNNMSPYLALNFCIATAGIFPSRS